MPKALIVGPPEIALLLERTMLWDQDVERVFATTPSTALDVARAFVPSLVVLDATDPAMALGLIRRLREHPGTRRSSIAVVSTSPTLPDEPSLLEAGASLVLKAPVDPPVWNGHLEKLLAVARRVRLRFPVRVRRRSAGAEEDVAAQALDLSLAGMLLETGATFPPDTAVELRFTLPGGGEELCLTGSVVRASSGTLAHVGVRFQGIERDTQDRIRGFLASVPPEKTFGRYEPLGLVGEGSMGRVYRAFDPVAQRVVAIKTLRSELLTGADAEEYLRRFRREAQAAGRLVHPNIITIFDVGDDYFVMEMLEGATLQTLLRQRGRLGLEEACRILAPVADALDYAHGMGTIHRDIKPANIMIAADGRPTVMDFGVAHLMSGVITASGQVFGSPSYMAPEQITRSEVTPQTDHFSFAVVAYETLTGHRPFEGESITPILYSVVNVDAPPPSTWNPDLPPGCDEALRRALAKDPRERFRSATDFVAALLQSEPSGASVAAVRAVEPPAPPSPTQAHLETLDLGSNTAARLRRSRWAVAAAAVAAVGLVAIGAALRWARGTNAGPAQSRIEITTDPAGAAVWLDGKPAGTSPVSLTRVAPGPHALRVTREDFVAAELSLETTGEGPPIPLRFTLQPQTGTLDIASEPAPASVRVDGQAAGSTPLSAFRLFPGTHRVVIERGGYRAWERTVDVRPGEAQPLVARLEPVSRGSAPKDTLRLKGWVQEGDLVALGPGVTPPLRLAGDPALYPPEARRLHLHGSVTVEMTVTETGAVADARVVESAGEILDAALLDAVRTWRFQSAESNGVKVRVRIQERQTFESGT